MFAIPIYQAERDAGLEQKILSSASIAYCSPITVSKDTQVAHSTVKGFRPEHAKASDDGQFDLHPLRSILVSTCWNLNDDVFDVMDCWAARKTPKNKQFNYMHDCADIIGVITGSYAIQDDGSVIADDTAIDDLPDKYHIVAEAVLYKYWSKEDLQERMDTILAEIEQDKWFVSMECLFCDYDYAIKDDSGVCSIVTRNKSTAFLSKHLRAYGGDGKYGNYRVGRVMRSFIFSGKGLVSKPANPESIIFANAEVFSSSATIFEVPEKSVYAKASVKTELKKEQVMADTNEQKIIDLQAELTSLKTSQTEAAVKQIRTELEVAQSALKAKDDEIKTLSQAKLAGEQLLASTKTELEAVNQKLQATETARATVSEKFEKIMAEQKLVTRVQTVKDSLKYPTEAATAFVNNLSALTDDQFKSQVDFLAAYITNNPVISGGTSSLPPAIPNQTPAPTMPKQTSLPANTTASEHDPKDGVKPEDLNTAKPEVGAAHAVSNSGASEVAQSIASYFGATETK
jgi:hypothetical protein